ncbi:competence protein ComK [Siminovitchia fortis]|uniref:Transcriptional regulator n=1 Tax=Siminovitchia fortis TaxID=254758 RepID=A0A443J2I2_9BACI|nr:competence protein ComK [Siminovitchia fortis]RWR14565.1 transcriptional regulator [Siminovitchia fortis]WHY80247.1 competence protein ComK [Siminovitchia fortis]
MAEKGRVLSSYEINPYTMMIRPAGDEYSEVIEAGARYLVSCRPFDIVKRSCAYFGSSYSGRRDGTKQLIGITYKAPIIVDPYTSIYLFPTASPASPQCVWISHDYIASYEKNGPYATVVTFQNSESFDLPVSFYSLENQVSRTAMLRIKFTQNMKRMEKFNKKPAHLLHNRASEPNGAYWINE